MSHRITGDEPINPTQIAGGDKSVVSIHTMSNANGCSEGLTIRQHFAAMAMQAICSNSADSQYRSNGLLDLKSIAAESTKMADALITELNKQP